MPQSSSTTSTAPPTQPTKVSTDATCGGTSGMTCQGSVFGNCCSPAGWCGSTAAYCGDGCQSGFGLCADAGTAAKGAVQVSTSAAVKSTLATSATSKAVTSKAATTTTSARPTQTTTSAKATPTASRLQTWVNNWFNKLRSGSN